MSKPAQSIHRFLDGHRGYLWRKSQLNGAWKNRYFILEKKKIRCYEDDSCLKLVSEMTVFNDTELFDLPGTSDNRANLIYFSASMDDVYYLSADHHIDKAYWLEAITDAKHSGFKLVDQPRLGMDPFYPSIDLGVTFGDNSIFASNDNKLQPHSIESAPSVIMRFGNPNSIYSLLMIDLDSVRANSEERTEYLMWGIVNIEGTDVSSGLELAPYESPSPEYGSGMHRYMFLLFDQSSDFTPDQFDLLDDIFSQREQFKHLDWMKQFHLKTPAGINGFYAGWEEYCDVLHERMGYTPAVVYYSPKMEAEAETARTEKARVDLFRDLVLGDIFPADEVDADSAPQHGTIAMTIEYDNDYVVEDGQTIPASQVKREPAVAFYPHPIGVDAQGNPECGLYTLVLVDPDAPSRINHDLREFIYWVVVNISDADVAKGDVALPYTGPAPSYASGLHRNVFCLYKQKKAFTTQEVEDTRRHFAGRTGITSFDWVRDRSSTLYKVPVGVEAFLSEWDLSVDDAHAAMHYMPPEQYRSPAQRRSTMLAGAGTPRPGFAAMTPRTADQDVIGRRLRKIHEAEALFNTKVIETSRVNTELAGANSGANSPKGDHDEMFGVDMDEEDESVGAKPAPKKVAQRNPVTFSGTSKTLAPKDASNQPLSLSLSEDNSTAASAAALRDSSNGEKNEVITSSRETTTANSTSVAKRAEHHTDQTQKANTLNKARRETSDGHFSEEVTESQHDQHHEERTERSEKSEHSELRHESHSTSTSAANSPRGYIQSGQLAIETSSELGHSRDMHESSSRNQQAQLKQLQSESQQRQEEDSRQQDQLRREQKNEVKRQQQELLERQAQEQERQQRLQQEQQERDYQQQQQQQQRGSSSRRQREQEERERQERERQEREAWELQQQQQQQQRSSSSSSRRQREQQEQQQQDAQEQMGRHQSSSRQQRQQLEQEQIPRQSSRRSAPEEHKDSSSPSRGGRTKEKDFFSALPDSEYSDTDTGSVVSGVPQSDRYQQEQQAQRAGSAPTSSTMRSQGHAAVDMEDQSVVSDASSQQPSVARSVDLRQQAAAKRAEGGGSAGRYKQLLEGLATVKSTTQLCDLFGVSTSSIFAGEKMKKKMNNDFMFKDSYIWVIPRTRTLHWSKTKGDAGDSKYLLLDTVTGVDPTAPPKGEFKGIVKRVRVSGPNLLITIESGDFLELKLSADGAPPAQKRANDWAVVIKAFTQS